MAETLLASASTAGAVLAFILAVASGISSRQGIRLLIIGMMLSWAPDLNRAVSRLATN
jgi:hypothetical protein